MIDARRLEVYYSIFTSKLDVFSRVKAEIIGANTFNHLLGKYFLHFFGDGSMKCSKLISHNNAFFYEGVIPTAKHMATLSYLKFTNKKFEDTAYFEPFYLKEFITTKAINKLN
jgi:tRNA threonylcarbamoyladenosine biosynthesis protein TsaB